MPMKKCFNCGATKGLKGIVNPDCDCGKCDGFHNHAVCKSCYFSEMVGCEFDMHSNDECLKDATCSNHTKTKALYDNWNGFDYNFLLKESEKQ